MSDRQELGGISGSREPSPSFTGLGPAGFDPGRVPTVIAWDEAASRLAAGDFAGFDSAMRIFRKLTSAIPPSKRGGPPAPEDS